MPYLFSMCSSCVSKRRDSLSFFSEHGSDQNDPPGIRAGVSFENTRLHTALQRGALKHDRNRHLLKISPYDLLAAAVVLPAAVEALPY